MIGRLISGRYEIIEKLGEGGMANVYKAKCNILGRFISIKVLKQELTNDKEFVCKFKDEAMEVAKLSNNNIVNVYDIGTEDDLHYIVMEYIDGKTLKEYISEYEILPIKTAIDFSIQICNALEAAHNINLIHRDVKSQNILVSKSGTIKVTDFGIAKSSDSATITNSGKILGSAYYIPPEQAKGGFVDQRSDIYSFGVVMYEMFTGKLPFTQGTPVNVALQHIQVDPVEPLELNSKLPVGINNLIIKCLQKNPALRYQSVKEIKYDLNSLQSNKKYMVSKCNIDDSTMVMSPLKSEYIEKESSNKYKKNGLVKSIVILLAAFVMIGLSVFMLNSKEIFKIFSQNIEVPSIVGKQGIQYERELESLGLKYELSGYVESDLEKDFVLDTHPKPGTTVKKNDVVKVILSGGIEQVRVPNIVDKSIEEARKILDNNNLKIGNIEEIFSEVYDVGKIIIQNPSYNSKTDKNGTVDIIISKGSETRLIVVPDFEGLDIVEAKNLASLNGIQVELTAVDTNVEKDHEKVFSQSIPKNIEIKQSVIVQLSYHNYVPNKKEPVKDPVQDSSNKVEKLEPENKNDITKDEENKKKENSTIESNKNNNSLINNNQSNAENENEINKPTTDEKGVFIPSVTDVTVLKAKELLQKVGLELDSNGFNDNDLIKEIDYEQGLEVPVGTKVKVISVY